MNVHRGAGLRNFVVCKLGSRWESANARTRRNPYLSCRRPGENSGGDSSLGCPRRRIGGAVRPRSQVSYLGAPGSMLPAAAHDGPIGRTTRGTTGPTGLSLLSTDLPTPLQPFEIERASQARSIALLGLCQSRGGLRDASGLVVSPMGGPFGSRTRGSGASRAEATRGDWGQRGRVRQTGTSAAIGSEA